MAPLSYSAFPSGHPGHPAGERVKGNEIRSAALEHSDLIQTAATHKSCHPEKFFPIPEPVRQEPQQEPQAAHSQSQRKPWLIHIRRSNGSCLEYVIFPCTRQVISKCQLNKLILTSYWFLIALKWIFPELFCSILIQGDKPYFNQATVFWEQLLLQLLKCQSFTM